MYGHDGLCDICDVCLIKLIKLCEIISVFAESEDSVGCTLSLIECLIFVCYYERCSIFQFGMKGKMCDRPEPETHTCVKYTMSRRK